MQEQDDEAAPQEQLSRQFDPLAVPVAASSLSLEELLEGIAEPKDAIWKRQPKEPALWYKRFRKFLLMDPRKVAKVFQEEEQAAVKRGRRKKPARTVPNGTWYEMAREWNWQPRAEAWDAWVASILEKHMAREKAKVLSSRYALMHERIRVLDGLVQQLLDYTTEKDLVWLPDVKSVGTGPNAIRVDLIQFNAPLFAELRAALADIAAEKGERVKTTKSELSGPDGGPIEMSESVIFYDVLIKPDEDEQPPAAGEEDASDIDQGYDGEGESE